MLSRVIAKNIGDVFLRHSVYSLVRTKCSQDRNTVYKTQKVDTQTKEKKS